MPCFKSVVSGRQNLPGRVMFCSPRSVCVYADVCTCNQGQLELINQTGTDKITLSQTFFQPYPSKNKLFDNFKSLLTLNLFAIT